MSAGLRLQEDDIPGKNGPALGVLLRVHDEFLASKKRIVETLDSFQSLSVRTDHAENLRLAGAALDQEAARRAVAREDWAAAEALVGDEVVRRHTASGTPAQVRARLDAYRAAGLDELVLGGLYAPDETARTVAVARGPA